MKKYRIAICDDDENIVYNIDEVVKKLFAKHCVEAETELYTSAARLWNSIENRGYDLVFLDIAIPGSDGVAVGKKICDRYADIDIIFVSSYESRVFDTFKAHPFGFVRKSNFLSDLNEVIGNYINAVIIKDEPTFTVNAKNGVRTFKCSDIVYLEGSGNSQMLYVKNSKEPIPVKCTLSMAEKELAPLGFLRIHKGILVNYNYISRILKADVELTTGMLLPMSRRKSAECKNEYFRLIRNKGNIIV